MRDSVLVVGAGPVGLMMAAELFRHGVGCRLVEKRTEPSPFCKALGVSPRTLEVFDAIGVARDAIDAGVWIRGQRVFVDGARVKENAWELAGSPYGTLSLPQYETERILAAALVRHGGAIERGIEVIGVRDAPDGVTAELRHADGKIEPWRGEYLIACDGARSTVRRALGLSFDGDRFPLDFAIADVRIDWPLDHGWSNIAVHTHEGQIRGVLVCIPVDRRGRYRVSTVLGAGSDAEDDSVGHGQIERPAPTLDEVQAIFRRLAPVESRVRDLRWSGYFRISHRIVQKYRVGRVFFAGDAAHIHPPTGGQGMNTGLQDAHNLAWKMALDLRGRAAPALLESYDAERRPIGEAIVESTTARTMSIRDRSAVDDATDRRADSQLDLNYKGGAWIAGDAGVRAEDAAGLTRDHVTESFRLFELLRGTSHVLLMRADETTSAAELARLEAVAAGLRARFGELVRAYLVVPPDVRHDGTPDLPVIDDAAGTFQRANALAPSAGVLVRPDGYTSFVGSLDQARLEAHLGRTLT